MDQPVWHVTVSVEDDGGIGRRSLALTAEHLLALERFLESLHNSPATGTTPHPSEAPTKVFKKLPGFGRDREPHA
jgi:hypothetical protein